ncbi:hypothetical protein MNB_SUP05-5-921 [hydrothermal vent metagenome]|uniref:Uncharacterized protein n=1 Tax=hydrothermal vent metagenome TaxID=652676 RepID=A0A1W1C628_9ZZZZ
MHNLSYLIKPPFQYCTLFPLKPLICPCRGISLKFISLLFTTTFVFALKHASSSSFKGSSSGSSFLSNFHLYKSNSLIIFTLLLVTWIFIALILSIPAVTSFNAPSTSNPAFSKSAILAGSALSR